MLTIGFIVSSDFDLGVNWVIRSLANGRKPVLTSSIQDISLIMPLAFQFGLEFYGLPDDPNAPEAFSLRSLMERISTTDAQVTLICDPVPFNMVFRNNAVIPSLHNRFNQIRVFHRLGIRRFYVESRTENFSISIPWTLDSFVDIHKGDRAFIIGNGPSLRETPMSRLKDEITFGSNRSFLGYKEWGMAFKYWGISDRLQIEAYREEYEENIDDNSVKFFPAEYISFLNMKNACPFNISSDLFFGSEKPLKFPYFATSPDSVFMAFTVTITLIQIAVMMGCNPIILLGIDHNYPIARVKRQETGKMSNITSTLPLGELSNKSKLDWDFWEGNAATGATHFTEKYTNNKIFVPPRTAWSEAAYDYCYLWGKRYGVDIINATPGTKLTSFPTANIHSFI